VDTKRCSRFADEEKHSRNIAKTCMVSSGQKLGVIEGHTMRDEALDPAMSW
jgi:hypothetical protein